MAKKRSPLCAVAVVILFCRTRWSSVPEIIWFRSWACVAKAAVRQRLSAATTQTLLFMKSSVARNGGRPLAPRSRARAASAALREGVEEKHPNQDTPEDTQYSR